MSALTDYISWLHAAGTHITHGHPLHSTAAKEREGKGVVADGEIGRVTKLWQRRHENWKAKEKNHKIMEERKQGRIVGRMGGGEAGRLERMSVRHLFELGAESVQLHFITCEGQQRCSFPMDTFYAPIYTVQQRLVILFFFSLSNTLIHVHVSPLRLPFLP